MQLMKDSMGNQTHECMEQTFMTISKGAFPPSRELDCVKFTFSWLKFRSLGGLIPKCPGKKVKCNFWDYEVARNVSDRVVTK